MRTTSIAALICLLSLAGTTRADDILAKKFLYHVPGQLRDFDPVEDALKQDGLKGQELKREAERIKIGLGDHGIAPTAKKNRRVVQPVDHQYSQLMGGTSIDKRALRMARAAQRRAMVARSDASGMATVNQDMAIYAQNVRRMTPHY